MEILFEFIFQIVIFLVQVVAEFALQVMAETLFESLGHATFGRLRRDKPLNPWLAGIGYILLGGIAGLISLWIFPDLFIGKGWVQMANLVLTPLLAGSSMALLGALRRRRGQELIRLDSFAYGYGFALAMALVRFGLGR